jgi:hypothetical protein
LCDENSTLGSRISLDVQLIFRDQQFGYRPIPHLPQTPPQPDIPFHINININLQLGISVIRCPMFGGVQYDLAVVILEFPVGPEMSNLLSSHPVLRSGIQNYVPTFCHYITDVDLETTEAILPIIGSVETVLMVGYPNAWRDTQNLLPVVRQGVTAVPAFLPYNGREEGLLDIQNIPGSSGSPIFIFTRLGRILRNGQPVIGDSVHFIGVVHATLTYTAQGTVVVPIPPALPTGPPQLHIEIPGHTGIYVKGHLISTFLPILLELFPPPTN